jgi:hypothetical protein
MPVHVISNVAMYCSPIARVDFTHHIHSSQSRARTACTHYLQVTLQYWASTKPFTVGPMAGFSQTPGDHFDKAAMLMLTSAFYVVPCFFIKDEKIKKLYCASWAGGVK